MSKSYFRAKERLEKILDSREVNLGRGFDIGFYSAMDYINLKKKSTSYSYAFPFSGKTSFQFDILMHIAKKYKIKIGLYSPECGTDTELVTYLVQVYLGKILHGKHAQEATDKEWLEALDFIHEHFLLLDPVLVGKDRKEFSAEEMFKQVYEAQKEYGWKIDILLCDPYNLLGKTPEDRRKSLADYTLENLSYINEVAKTMDMHISIAMHLRDADSVIDKDTGVEYMPRPMANGIANGQSVWRVMKLGMGLWRCPEGVMEKSTGYPYPANATDFLVQKNKSLGTGTTGSFRLFFDSDSQKFYEIINNKKYYCGEYEEEILNKMKPSSMKPNLDFGKDLSDSAPF